MRNYVIRRLLQLIPILVGITFLSFAMMRVAGSDAVTEMYANKGAVSQEVIDAKRAELGLDKPFIVQYTNWVTGVLHGDLGTSFSQYPRKVSDIISSAIGWTICLQLPAILVGWLLGNLLGALAAYIRKGFDKVLLPVALFMSNVPAFGMAVTLLVIFAVKLKVAPIAGGYSFDMIPNMSWRFIRSVITHYQLPFWSIVLVSIGGQAIGMRSMSIYELNADYVKYARFLGIKDRKIVGYVFRNAMLPR